MQTITGTPDKVIIEVLKLVRDKGEYFNNNNNLVIRELKLVVDFSNKSYLKMLEFAHDKNERHEAGNVRGKFYKGGYYIYLDLIQKFIDPVHDLPSLLYYLGNTFETEALKEGANIQKLELKISVIIPASSVQFLSLRIKQIQKAYGS